MDPSNLRLVTEAAEVLRTRIAPALSQDPRAASELRSLCAVLGLVAARMEHEAGVLAADNVALRQLLSDLESTIDVPPVPAHDGDPDGLNIALRSALEQLIPDLHDGRHPDQLAAVRTYLCQASQQEKAIYGPLTAFPPF